MAKKAAMILSGCGVYDGSEIHESTMLLLACAEHQISVDGFAPVINQSQVMNHINQTKDAEVRNVYKESARIMRGNVQPLDNYKADDYSFLLFPGGFGAVTNLCNFGLVESMDFNVNQPVVNAINHTYEKKKPMVFMCISPMIAARVLGQTGLKLTMGNDQQYLNKLTDLGAKAVSVGSREIVWDETHRVASSPAYMLAKSIIDVYQEATQLIKIMASYE